jgi:glycine cleavage system aminomethyltransferase T
MERHVAREVRAVRSGVGVCDVSTLGKIDVQGRDADTFLDRVYINMFSTLPSQSSLWRHAARGRHCARRRHLRAVSRTTIM